MTGDADLDDRAQNVVSLASARGSESRSWMAQSSEPTRSSDEGEVPRALDAERAVLGSVLLDNRTLDAIGDQITPEDFSEEVHRHIFGAMLDRWRLGEGIAEVFRNAEDRPHALRVTAPLWQPQQRPAA